MRPAPLGGPWGEAAAPRLEPSTREGGEAQAAAGAARPGALWAPTPRLRAPPQGHPTQLCPQPGGDRSLLQPLRLRLQDWLPKARPSTSWGCRWQQPEPPRPAEWVPGPPSGHQGSPPRSPRRANGRGGREAAVDSRGARLRSAGGQRGELGPASGVRLAPPSTPSPWCAVGLGVRARGGASSGASRGDVRSTLGVQTAPRSTWLGRQLDGATLGWATGGSDPQTV